MWKDYQHITVQTRKFSKYFHFHFLARLMFLFDSNHSEKLKKFQIYLGVLIYYF